MRAVVFLTGSVALLLVAGCAGSAPLDDRMFDHFGRSGQIQTALIVGDLEGARRPASWLSEHEGFAELGPDAEPWLAEIRTSARAVAEASSVDQAADATGSIGRACAGCHAAFAGGPTFRSGAGAPPARSRSSHMIRHLWAMDRMWEGLVGGSDETWRSGAAAIADEEPESGFPGGGTTAAMAENVHRQAGRALDAAPGDRPGAYAEMLKGCAGCHALVGAGAD